jgi:CheY-like chemotaxis protein
MSPENRIPMTSFLQKLLPGFPGSARITNAPNPVHRTRQQTRKSILFLDDNQLTLRYVRLLLGDDFDVLICPTIDEAIAYIRTHPIDYFVSDFHLADNFTGAQAIQRLSAETNFNPKDCILVTSDSSKLTRESAISSGFSRIFIKPLSNEFKLFFDNISSAQ